MKLTPKELNLIRGMADFNNLPFPTVMSVISVESNGVTHTLIDGQTLPVIRWEGHYFDRLVPAKKRAEARRVGLANPEVGGVKNPKCQADRYKLLARAMKIDRDAAIMSCSWGVGQVMGSHWKALGFKSASDFYQVVCASVVGQVDVMFRYIVRNGLLDELQRFDWAGFARGYNGPAYKKFAYHTKLAAAYKLYAGQEAPTSPASGMLRMGSAGKRVRELQGLLVRANFPVKVDGDFGPSTREALRGFQKSNGLTIDGVAGPETMQVLNDFRVDPAEDLGATPMADNAGVRNGAVSAIGGVSAATTAEKINGVADQIGVTGLQWLDYAVTGLYVVSGVLVLGGLAWGAYAYLKDRQTYEGVS